MKRKTFYPLLTLLITLFLTLVAGLYFPPAQSAQYTAAGRSAAPSDTAPGDAASVTIVLNTVKFRFSGEQPFIGPENRTLVPAGFVCEALGADISWDGSSQTVGIYRGRQEISLKIGQNRAFINGLPADIDSRPVIKNGRAMIPLRLICVTLGFHVEWIPLTRTVEINSNVESGDDSHLKTKYRELSPRDREK